MYCLVFHSTTKGRPSRVVACGLRKVDADREKDRHNRGQGFGGFWNVHPHAVVARWAAMPEHHQFTYDIDVADLNKRSRRR